MNFVYGSKLNFFLIVTLAQLLSIVARSLSCIRYLSNQNLVVLTIFFEYRGVVHSEILLEGQTSKKN